MGDCDYLGPETRFAPRIRARKTAMGQFKNPRGKRSPLGFTKENRHWGDRGKGLGKTSCLYPSNCSLSPSNL